jgi:hypothetical protein
MSAAVRERSGQGADVRRPGHIRSRLVTEGTTPSRSQVRTPGRGREEGLVWSALWIGLSLALIGLIDGLVMAFKRHVAPCPNGTYFPQGTTDFNCYVHPRAGVGIAITVFSVLLGTLLVFTAILAAGSLRARATTGVTLQSPP